MYKQNTSPQTSPPLPTNRNQPPPPLIMEPIQADEKIKGLESTIKRLSKHVQKYKKDHANQKTKADQQQRELTYAQTQLDRERQRYQTLEQQVEQQKSVASAAASAAATTNTSEKWLQRQVSRLTADTALNVSIARWSIAQETKRAQLILSHASTQLTTNAEVVRKQSLLHFQQLQSEHDERVKRIRVVARTRDTSNAFVSTWLSSTVQHFSARSKKERSLTIELDREKRKSRSLDKQNSVLQEEMSNVENMKRIDRKAWQRKYDDLEREVHLLRYTAETMESSTQTNIEKEGDSKEKEKEKKNKKKKQIEKYLEKEKQSIRCATTTTQTKLEGDEQWFHWREARKHVDRKHVERMTYQAVSERNKEARLRKEELKQKNRSVNNIETQTERSCSAVLATTGGVLEKGCNTKLTGDNLMVLMMPSNNRKENRRSCGTQSKVISTLSLGCQTNHHEMVTRKETMQDNDNHTNEEEEEEEDGEAKKEGDDLLLKTPIRNSVDTSFKTPNTISQKPSVGTMVSQLQNLNELKKDGFFTEDEFTQVKQVVMLPFLTQNNIHAQQSHFQDQSQTLKEQELNRERYLLNNGDGGLLNVVENDDSHCSSGGGGGGGSNSGDRDRLYSQDWEMNLLEDDEHNLSPPQKDERERSFAIKDNQYQQQNQYQQKYSAYGQQQMLNSSYSQYDQYDQNSYQNQQLKQKQNQIQEKEMTRNLHLVSQQYCPQNQQYEMNGQNNLDYSRRERRKKTIVAMDRPPGFEHALELDSGLVSYYSQPLLYDDEFDHERNNHNERSIKSSQRESRRSRRRSSGRISNGESSGRQSRKSSGGSAGKSRQEEHVQRISKYAVKLSK